MLTGFMVSMGGPTAIVAAVGVALGVIALAVMVRHRTQGRRGRRRGGSTREEAGEARIKPRRALRSTERAALFMLRAALDEEFVVLCKVPMNRLFAAGRGEEGAARKLGRWTAQFAVLTRDAMPIAVCEIQGSDEDEAAIKARTERAQVVSAAGVEFVLFDPVRLPSKEELRHRMRAVLTRRNADPIDGSDAFTRLPETTRIASFDVPGQHIAARNIAPRTIDRPIQTRLYMEFGQGGRNVDDAQFASTTTGR